MEKKQLKIWLTAAASWFLINQAVATTYYVSSNGKDSNNGAKESPFQTINKAAQMAMPGDTVFVYEGIYRERVTPPRGGKEGMPILYLAEPDKRVIIRGSETWAPQWKQHTKGIYSAMPHDSLFNDRSPEYIDHYNPFKVNLSSTPHQRQGRREWERDYGGDSTLLYTCGQVFVNGKMLKEVPFMDELETGTWYFEPESEYIYINFGTQDPSRQEIDITTRRRIFAPKQRGLGYITVEGFVMEHCGNNYPTNFWKTDEWAQKGAMGIEMGHHWIIRRNVIRYAKSFALDVGHVDQHGERYGAYDNLIEENYIIENGSAGILSNSSLNMIIRGNVVMYNNTLGFLGKKRWEQAGIKCHHMKDGIIHDNYVASNNLTYGIWLDNHFPDSRVTRNVLVNNGRAGLFLELSDYGFDRLFVDNNVIVDNKENPVYTHNASGATIMHNILANTFPQEEFGQAVKIWQADPRTRTYHHSFYNNLLLNNPWVFDVDYPSHRGGPHRMDFNVYDVTPDERKFAINKYSDQPPPWSDDEFLELIHHELGKDAPQKKLIDGKDKAKLNFQEWKKFWQVHGLENDENSILSRGNRVCYNTDTYELTIEITFEPDAVGTKSHQFVDVDYFGNSISQDGKAKPGPFQDLKKGKNKFLVWDGLPVLRKGFLPEPARF